MNNEVLSWADFFMNGSLIDIDVSVWDGLVRLLPDDLGIAKTEAVKTAITFGHERLVPKGSLAEIRTAGQQAREAVDEMTMPFKLVPGSRFLPKATRETLNTRLGQIANQFEKSVNEFIAKYHDIRAEHRVVLREALLEASRGNATAANAALERIESLYPTEPELRDKFGISWRVFSIAAPIDGTESRQGSVIMGEIENIIDRARGQLTEKVGAIMELAGRGGKITAKTYKSALKVCDRIDRLNFFADSGLRSAVAEVRKAIEAAVASEDPGAGLAKGLESISDELLKSREDAVKAAARMITGQAERRFAL